MRSCNHCYSGKAMCHVFWVCVFVVIQHAMSMRHFVNCGLPRSTIYFFFPHYLINDTILERKKIAEHKMCVVVSSTTFVRNVSRSKKNLVIIRSKTTSGYVKYPLFLSDFNETWIFSIVFRKILKHQISWKSIQWEPSCSMRTGGWT